MPLFERYIGIDYSGAAKPVDAVGRLRVFVADRDSEPEQERDVQTRSGFWSRQRLAEWLRDRLREDMPTIVGVDHAFSYPVRAMDASAQESWDAFLRWFEARWPTRTDAVREHVSGKEAYLKEHGHSLRLTDRWTSTAMSIFKGFEAKGPNVFFSTHAGIPWLRWLREEVRQGAAGSVHFWPFDGFEVPPGRRVVVEVYPRLFRRRYEWDASLTEDERDAWLVCRWLQERDRQDRLDPYFQPPLGDRERQQAGVEGWILGVM